MPSGCAIFNGTTSFGRYNPGATVIGTLPLTICGWIKPGAIEAETFFNVCTSTVNVSAGIRQEATEATSSRNNSVNATTTGLVLATDNTVWYPFVGVFTATDQRIYVNASNATNGTDTAAANWTNICAGGVLLVDVPVTFIAARLAQLSIHTAEFSAGDIAAFTAGTIASALPSPFAWYKLETNGNDSIGTRHLTLTDVTFDAADGPPVVYPPSEEWKDPSRTPDRSPSSTPKDRLRILRDMQRVD